MKRQVSWSSAWFRRDSTVVCKSSILFIESIDDDLVDTQINDECVAVRLIHQDAMRVRTQLPIAIYAGAAVLHDANRASQTPITFDW